MQLHVSMVEAEQMRFDEDYQCEMTKTDLERIQRLPDQIQLAMPFLHTYVIVFSSCLVLSFLV